MKIKFILQFTLICFFAVGQTQQNINKNTGVVSNAIDGIDSIRFNASSTTMEIVLQNGTIESHSISDIVNVNFSSVNQHSCGTINVHNPDKIYGTLTDIDGNNYKTIEIGSYMWMAENLKVSHFSNGDIIPLVISSTQWNSETPAACWYNNDSATFECPYGKLYNSFVIADVRNVCPDGWHVPNDNEWSYLNFFLGNDAGNKLKSTNTEFWNESNSTITNSSGFSALPGGYRRGQSFTTFDSLGVMGVFWNSSFCNSGNTGKPYFLKQNANNLLGGTGLCGVDYLWNGPNSGFSIRCLSDSNNYLMPSINSFECNNALNIGVLNQGSEAIGVTTSIQYTGGNGAIYNSQEIESSGVLGLIATLAGGNLALGNGSIILTISGVPTNTGVASFTLNLGGQICVINRFVSVSLPNVGDNFGGGIVAYILQPGDAGFDPLVPHGIVAAENDLSSSFIWGCNGQLIGGTGSSIGDGGANTNAIIAGCATPNIAAKLCSDLLLNGYSDWLLPSLDELNKLYLNREVIGGFNNSFQYWSSTENNASGAFNIFFGGGDIGSSGKQNMYKVRPVRIF
jgi:uncharacterized protein (TIGR02145 family)